jgi:hypothetical protein
MEASQKLAGGNPNLLPINLARQYSTVYHYTSVPMEAAVFLFLKGPQNTENVQGILHEFNSLNKRKLKYYDLWLCGT